MYTKSLKKLKVWKLEKYRQVEMTEWIALVNIKDEESKIAESIVLKNKRQEERFVDKSIELY